jgi:hypothetical protein
MSTAKQAQTETAQLLQQNLSTSKQKTGPKQQLLFSITTSTGHQTNAYKLHTITYILHLVTLLRGDKGPLTSSPPSQLQTSHLPELPCPFTKMNK